MKLTQDELYGLVEKLSTLDVNELTVKSDDLTIKIKHGKKIVASNAVQVLPQSEDTQVSDIPAEEVIHEGEAICAPIHGTYYSSPSPDEAPYVKVGDVVKQGQTICILEAMKMMNTVSMPVNGIITAIEVGNEDIVDAKQVLLRYVEQ